MKKITKKYLARRFVDMCIGVIIGLLLGLDIVFARSIDMSKAGVSLWVFIVVGAFIILLQLIPAIILFTTFIGSITKALHDKVPVEELEEDATCCKVKENV